MEIREERHGAVTVLTPKGPLTREDAGVFASRVGERSAQLLGRIAVDASLVSYVDSKGLESILEVSESLAASGQVLRVANMTPNVREALEITGLSGAVEVFADLNSAIRSFA